ncbi:MAG TPA: nuclear transport factor 2 family protein [Micromonosporaceae bacterium]|jgi:ketosteroid isomerase-like protein
MTDRDDFLAWLTASQRSAELALHNGDPEPRTRTWSHREPVTLFGAHYSAVGWDDVNAAFDRLGVSFGGYTRYEPELLTVEVHGDLAYTVGFENTDATFDGVASEFHLRVTQIYRREEGEWKVVHRHADNG